MTAAYTITPANQVVQPAATPAGGNYETAQTVTLASATTGADIYYTLDGTEPTSGSDKYSSPITISGTTTLKAIAVKSDMDDSSILTATYTITPPTFSVTFDADGGTPAPDNLVDIEPGYTIAQPPAMTRPYHTFDDWYTDSERTVTAVFPITVDANISLYAKWTTNAVTLTSIADVNSYLDSLSSNTADNPANLTVNFNLGIMTEADSGWRQLLDAISTAGKYVDLNLSACTMSGNSFNPDSSVATGKDKIVSLVLPIIATGINNGTSSNPTFRNFSNLKSISGAYVITIGDYSFYYNTSLQSVDFPRATSIGRSALYRCTSLQNVNIPQATSIGSSALYGCTGLQNVNFPQVKTIGTFAFSDCSGLQSLSFPQATTIAGSAFESCTNLQSMSFPASVTLDGQQQFRGCTSLTSITLSGTGSLSVIENGKALVQNGNTLIAYPSASGTVTLGYSITTIVAYAFGDCTGLQSVNSSYVTIIGGSAFYRCTGLQSASFSQATDIGGGAFSVCTSLQNLNIPRVTNIGPRTFFLTGDTTLSITMGSVAPTLDSQMFDFVGSFDDETKMVEISIPVGSTGYSPASSPFTGTPVMVSGTDTAENWANGFRGGGWDGMTWKDSFLNPGGPSEINQNINIFFNNSSM